MYNDTVQQLKMAAKRANWIFDLPEDNYELLLTILGHIGAGQIISRLRAEKITAILQQLYDFPVLRYTIMDIGGLMYELSEIDFRRAVSEKYLKNVGVDSFEITSKCVRKARENPLPNEVVKIIKILYKKRPEELRLLSQQIAAVDIHDNVLIFTKRSNFKNALLYTLPRATLTFNLFRLYLRDNPLLLQFSESDYDIPIDAIVIQKENLWDVLETNLKSFRQLATDEILIEFKNFISNKFLYLEAMNIYNAVYKRPVHFGILPFMLFSWYYYASYKQTRLPFITGIEKIVKDDLKELNDLGLVEKVKKGYYLPTSKQFVDLSGNEYKLALGKIINYEFKKLVNEYTKNRGKL